MMHNSYFAFGYQPYSVLLILSAIRLMWVRTEPVLAKKKPFDQLFVKGRNRFFVKVFIGV